MGLPMENDLLAATSEQIMESESKFDTKELIVVNISNHKYCLNRSRDMSYDHFSKKLKIDLTGGGFKKRSQAV